MSNQLEDALVSICIPCYNHENFICDCLDSLINQTYQNIELLICDDCSKDRSWEKIEEYEPKLRERFRQVVLLKSETNKGVSKTLNELISKCTGTYIKTIASDDFLDSKYTEIMVGKMKSDEKIGVLFCNGIYMKEESTYAAPVLLSPYFVNPVQISNRDMEQRLFENCFIFAPGVILKKEVYDECGLYNEDIEIEDWEYWLRIACSKKFKFAYMDDILVYYRKSENAMTSRIGADGERRYKRMYNAEKKIIELYAGRMGKKVGARKKIWHIIYGERIAYKLNFKNNIKMIKADYDNFDEWKYLSYKDKIICKSRHFLRFASKFI